MARHGKLNDGKKKRLKKMGIGEISSVTIPAADGADAILMKVADEDTVSKNVDETPFVITSAIEGHSHGIWLHGNGGSTTYQASEGSDRSHEHPWVFENGGIFIGESEGHTHEVDSVMVMNSILIVNKSKTSKDVKEFIDSYIKSKEAVMPESKAELEAAQAQVTELNGKVELLTKMASLNDVEKTHLETLDEEGQTTFLSKSAADRTAELKELEIAKTVENPIEYTCDDGTKIRKSDGELLVKMARERDEDRKELAKVRSVTEDEQFAKLGDNAFGSLPGERTVRGAIAKALHTITDEVLRKTAVEAITAGSNALAKGFDSLGAGPISIGGSNEAEDKLETLAKARMNAEGEDYYTAYDVVTKANPDLSQQAIKGSN